MKKMFITLCLLPVCTIGIAQTKMFESISLGLSGGYTNDKTISSEIALQTGSILFQRPVEWRFGIDYRKFNTNFQKTDGLETKSVGLFADAVIFPFQKYFFTGIRWDLITLNWFTDNALEKLGSGMSSGIFSGTNFYGIVGIDIPVFKRINFRLSGMPGVQQYKVSDGNFSSGSYVSNGTVQENHTRFVYQLNATMIIRIK
jgi:hypothetical protein